MSLFLKCSFYEVPAATSTSPGYSQQMMLTKILLNRASICHLTLRLMEPNFFCCHRTNFRTTVSWRKSLWVSKFTSCENWTRDCWVRSMNASSVLCRPPVVSLRSHLNPRSWLNFTLRALEAGLSFAVQEVIKQCVMYSMDTNSYLDSLKGLKSNCGL